MAADSARSLPPSSLFRVVASAYLLNVAGRIADVCWLLLLFTVLSVREVAVFAFASATAAFFAMALDAGLNQTLLREFSARRLTILRGARLAAKVRVAFLLVVAVLAFSWVKVFGGDAYLIEATVLACGVQLWILIESFCQQWLKANDRQTLANTLAAVEPFLKLGAVAALFITGDSVTTAEFFIAQNAYHLLLVGACIWACRLSPKSTSGVSLGSTATGATSAMLRASAWFALIGIMTVLQNRLDWLLVANFTSDSVTASYSLVNRAYEVLMMLIGSGALTLFPLLCRNSNVLGYSGDVWLLRKAVLAAGVLGAGISTIVLPVLCELVWGGKYADAPTLFRLLMPIAALSTFIQIMYYEAVARRSEKKLLYIGIASTLLQLIVNAILIPILGAAGAAGGMLTLAISNIVLYSAMRRGLGLPEGMEMRRLAAYAAAMTCCWLLIAMLPIGWLLQFAAVGCCWVSFTGFWLLSVEQRRSVRALLTGRIATLRVQPE